MTGDELTRDGLAFVWRQHLAVAAGVVEVPAPAGSRWWADALDPHTVVAWSAAPAGGLDGLAGVFGSDWASRVLPVLTGEATATDVDLAPPRLSEGWARLVVVLGVRQWFPKPIDELALSVDEALAWHGAGEPEMAALTVRQVAPVVIELVEQLFEGRMPVTTVSMVEAARDLALLYLDDDDPDREELVELELEMQRRVGLAVEGLDGVPPQWAIDDDAAMRVSEQWQLAGARVMGGNNLDERSVAPAEIDPTTVTARILVWGDQNPPEVRARVDEDAVLVEVGLADGVETYDREASSIIAYTCDRDTGEVLERAPMTADEGSRVLTARLVLHGRVHVAVGVYEARLVDQVRSDPLGRALTRLDRSLLTSWATRRLTHIARAEAQHELADNLYLIEKDYSARTPDALNEARSLAATTGGLSGALVERIEARLAALNTLSIDSAVQAPTIAEALSLRPADADEKRLRA